MTVDYSSETMKPEGNGTVFGSDAERKELPVQQHILQKWKGNEDILRWRKPGESVACCPVLKELLKGAF